MPPKVPSKIIRVIDQWFPWVKDWATGTKVTERENARGIGAWCLPGLVEMIDQIPDELLTLESGEATDFLFARAALRKETQVVMTGGRGEAVNWPMLGSNDCVYVVQEALSKCPDEAPSTTVTASNSLATNPYAAP